MQRFVGRRLLTNGKIFVSNGRRLSSEKPLLIRIIPPETEPYRLDVLEVHYRKVSENTTKMLEAIEKIKDSLGVIVIYSGFTAVATGIIMFK